MLSDKSRSAWLREAQKVPNLSFLLYLKFFCKIMLPHEGGQRQQPRKAAVALSTPVSSSAITPNTAASLSSWRVARPAWCRRHRLLLGTEVRRAFGHAQPHSVSPLPQAIFLPARFEVYRAVSQQIMAIFRQQTALVVGRRTHATKPLCSCR